MPQGWGLQLAEAVETKTGTEQAASDEARLASPSPPAVEAPAERPSNGAIPVEGSGAIRDIRAVRPYFVRSLLNGPNYRRVTRFASLLLLDLIGVYWSIYSALAIKELVHGDYVASKIQDTASELVAFAYLVTVLLFARNGLYAKREVRPGFARIISCLFQVAIVSVVYALIQNYDFSSYYLFYGTLIFASVYITGLRSAYEWITGRILRALGYKRRAVLVGSGDHIDAVSHALENGAHTKYDTVGYISLTPRPPNGLLSLGELSDLPGHLDRHEVDEVILADPDFPQDQAVELVDMCHRRGVSVRIAPSTMELLVHQADFVPGEAVPLFELKPPVFEGFDYVIKRTFDFVGSAIILFFLSPLLLLIALGVRLSSRGPALYRSIRPGIGGQPFPCLKFRTMYMDADKRQADFEEMNEQSGAIFKIRDDPRLTRIGRFLRRYSLDELPQLLNVLKGDMSLVGPRPLPLRDYDRLDDWHKKRYLVLPGVTGLWQVSGRSDLDFDDLVRLDFLYLERWSVFLDLSILLKTLPAVVTRKGAY
jgi:exopolysaccharide biosynthesis polyprenyl glycosylphosphotransferase